MSNEESIAIDGSQQKFCNRCKKWKDASSFFYMRANTVISTVNCQTCRDRLRPYSKAWYKDHPKYYSDYYKVNKARYQPRSKAYYEANKEQIKERRKYDNCVVGHSQHRVTYGEKRRMAEAQGYCCSICHKRVPELGRLHVDHNHVTGQVRKLLCHYCNHMLGNSHEDMTILQSAIDYLCEHEHIEINVI